MGAVKGGRSPAQRMLDGDHGTRQSSLAECRRHGAAFSNGSKSAGACKTSSLNLLSALPNRGMCEHRFRRRSPENTETHRHVRTDGGCDRLYPQPSLRTVIPVAMLQIGRVGAVVRYH